MKSTESLFDASRCLFTGSVTDSSEHVIPRWLQSRFQLGEQTMVIPNGTQLKYRLHKVPADRGANNKFGRIEERISRGVFVPDEVYLWALKIHIGCIYRDATLRVDIRDKNSEYVLDVSDFEQEVWLFQKLFQSWAEGGHTSPSPFGSVFIVDSLFARPTFDFMHCLRTGTVGINIGDKFILVLLWDQGEAGRSNMLDIWRDWHVKNTMSMIGTEEHEANAYMAHHVWACECAYGAFRRRRPFRFVAGPSTISLVPSLSESSGKPFDPGEYKSICRNFGLDLLHSDGEIGNRYTQLYDVRLQRTEPTAS
jgi:hypothetical protein